MKRKLLVGLVMALVLSLSACGGSEGTTGADKESSVQSSGVTTDNSDTKDGEGSKNEETEEQEPEKEEIELPNWVGVTKYVGTIVYATEEGQSEQTHIGDYGIHIDYPSKKGNSGTSGMQYQTDFAAVAISTGGYDENNNSYKIENIEDTFYLHMEDIIYDVQHTKGYRNSDFVFEVEKQETSTINNMQVCYYEGQLTYIYDKYEEWAEERQRPFAAYSFYTGQIEGYSYFTVVVIDDTQDFREESLPEGTIQAYARKMVESVTIE